MSKSKFEVDIEKCLERLEAAKQNRIKNGRGTEDDHLLPGMHEKYDRYMHNSFRRGIAWKLTKAQFRKLVESDCHYCGEKPFTYEWNGIDRVDNRIGYGPTNAVPCCSMCNRMKWAYGVDEFENKARQIAAHLERRGA